MHQGNASPFPEENGKVSSATEILRGFSEAVAAAIEKQELRRFTIRDVMTKLSRDRQLKRMLTDLPSGIRAILLRKVVKGMVTNQLKSQMFPLYYVDEEGKDRRWKAIRIYPGFKLNGHWWYQRWMGIDADTAALIAEARSDTTKSVSAHAVIWGVMHERLKEMGGLAQDLDFKAIVRVARTRVEELQAALP